MVYMQGDLEHLHKLESGLPIFCNRSNVVIIWNKSCAIWLSHETYPTWHWHPAFKWINQAENTKYLGFQIGFNIPPKTMIAPNIHSIWQKLTHCSSKVANQVLLATTWYNLSCWTSPGKVYTRFNNWYAATFGLVRKIMQFRPRWHGLYSPHLSREEGWVWLMPYHNPKPYLPNLWCEDSNQGMTTGKCYCGYASLNTLVHKMGPTGPPKRAGF